MKGSFNFRHVISGSSVKTV